MSSPAASYRGYADLAGQQVEGTDYQVHVRANARSSVAVIAPRGGGIERYTSEIARAIAGDDFNLYVFEGVRRSGNYAALHLTSHWFDEPQCLELLSGCDHVVAIHGCSGDAQQVLVGGLDTVIIAPGNVAVSCLLTVYTKILTPSDADFPLLSKQIHRHTSLQVPVHIQVKVSIVFQQGTSYRRAPLASS